MGTVVIIGGGPAGYVAAITAARKGQQVIVIEDRQLGGTCLNEGCIPTKSLLESAETLEQVKRASAFGIAVPASGVNVDWYGVQQYKNSVMKKLVLGVGYLMKKNKVQVIQGKASFLTDRVVKVEKPDGVEEVAADRFIIATGSEPIELPFAPFDGSWIIHSSQAMSLSRIPATLLIVGGGVIGCEFASIYSRMGAKVTIVEMAEQLLPGEDRDIAEVLKRRLEEDGATIYTGTALSGADAATKTVSVQTGAGVEEIRAEHVLVAIGRKPRVEELGLDRIGVQYSGKGIQVDETMQTSVSHIYACGDVIGGIQLAHVAFHEGEVAALNACGVEKKASYRAVPRCIYTSPEIASVGLTELQARERYGDVRVGEFPFAANGKALILHEQAGKVKVIVEPTFNEIVGISIVGPRATEMVGQGTVMLHAEMTADAMEDFIAAHPTLSETLLEAILNATGQAIHG
ncbi:dihydrolipoamide dehydrogenase [Brevibacillus borstelensis AK1]|uniref:Dihydrolipoyl dehydrogenase n=1 Tax=Brevibacillus borstelensis AK1 TaxID=1300222 RepID=M8DW98_9BACL|nr:dihydrolipoyl dehydrogenase [Brevibacillus borstelensis]EMT51281.1 dihydrolipoamide dehydrogenase [Brevibacillus borstelensis AK1]